MTSQRCHHVNVNLHLDIAPQTIEQTFSAFSPEYIMIMGAIAN